MLTIQNVVGRLVESGLTLEGVLNMPDQILNDFLHRRSLMIVMQRPEICECCGKKQVSVLTVEAEQVPEWLRLLLTQSASRITKKP